MADIQQIKAQLMQCSAKLGEASGVFQHATSFAEEAQHILHGAMEGTSQADYSECAGLIADAMAKADTTWDNPGLGSVRFGGGRGGPS